MLWGGRECEKILRNISRQPFPLQIMVEKQNGEYGIFELFG